MIATITRRRGRGSGRRRRTVCHAMSASLRLPTPAAQSLKGPWRGGVRMLLPAELAVVAAGPGVTRLVLGGAGGRRLELQAAGAIVVAVGGGAPVLDDVGHLIYHILILIRRAPEGGREGGGQCAAARGEGGHKHTHTHTHEQREREGESAGGRGRARHRDEDVGPGDEEADGTDDTHLHTHAREHARTPHGVTERAQPQCRSLPAGQIDGGCGWAVRACAVGPGCHSRR